MKALVVFFSFALFYQHLAVGNPDSEVTENAQQTEGQAVGAQAEVPTKPTNPSVGSKSEVASYRAEVQGLKKETKRLVGELDATRKSLEQARREANKIRVANKALAAQAQVTNRAPAEEKPKAPSLSFGAMLDIFYTYDFNEPAVGATIPSRNYDIRHHDFTVNLIEVNLSASYRRWSLYADLDFGDFANQNAGHGNDTADGSGAGDPISHHVGQAYLQFDFSDVLNVAVGKMYTHVGYEVAKAIENWNYSRSFAFSLAGPFWHEGVAFNYAGKGGLQLGAYLYDMWDSRVDNNRGKTFGGRLGYSAGNFTVLYNTIYGHEDATNSTNLKYVHEVNTQYDLGDSLSVAGNVVFGTHEQAGGNGFDRIWLTAVAYAHFKAGSRLSVTPRAEYFMDQTNSGGSSFIFGGAAPANLLGLTLTSTYKFTEQVQGRIEVRGDMADASVFVDKNGAATKTRILTTAALLMAI